MIGEQRRGSTRRPLEWLEIGDMDMEGEGVITIIGAVGASTKVKGTTGEVDMVGVDRGWDREGSVEDTTMEEDLEEGTVEVGEVMEDRMVDMAGKVEAMVDKGDLEVEDTTGTRGRAVAEGAWVEIGWVRGVEDTPLP